MDWSILSLSSSLSSSLLSSSTPSLTTLCMPRAAASVEFPLCSCRSREDLSRQMQEPQFPVRIPY